MTTFNLGGDTGNSFRFETPGDQITGKIIDLVELQQTDLKTGEPKTFENGQPMMMYRVDLQTELRDPADQIDTGARSVYLKGSKKAESQSSLAAVLAAVIAATGTANISTGGTLTLQYIGDGPQRNRGFNPPKLYSASYQPPAINIGEPVQQPPQAPVHQFAQQAPAPVVQQPIQQAPAAAPTSAPAPAAQPAAPQITPELLAAMRAAGIDPTAVASAAGA